MSILDLTSKIPAPVWLLLSAFCIAVGDFSSKHWANNPSMKAGLLTVLVYSLSSVCWLPALYARNELAILGTIWGVLVSILTVGIGVLCFHEVLDARHWAGVCLAIVAVGLLSS